MKRDQAAPTEGAKPELGETLEFLRGVWALAHALETASRKMQRRLGVTGAQRFVIRMVGRYPQISAGDLADTLHLHPSTLSLLIAKMESRGFLARVTDPNDARRALFALTPRGRNLDREAAGTIESRVGATLRRVSPAKVHAAREVMAALAVALEREEAPVGRRGARSPAQARGRSRSKV